MSKKKVYLIGIGMGGNGTLTECARKQIETSEILIGAKRMLEGLVTEDKECFVSYKADEIGAYLKGKETFRQAAILLSGDVGFYSGAKKLLKELEPFEVELIPGISSMVYFCSRLQVAWEDVCFASAHGKNVNQIQRIKRHRKCFFLLDGAAGLNRLCEKLLYYGMWDVTLHVGENLSYKEERIVSGSPDQVKDLFVSSLAVVLAENPNPENWAARSIPDSDFIRTKVPMTKSEVRTVSIGKLQLKADSTVYDVGGGSGSVSIEMALQAPDIQVYSIEKKEAALQLMEANKRKFAADNMEIVEGTAPEALETLPAPTHAFIGGSSGNMKEIIDCILSKNPDCRIVINTIALNSLAEVLAILEQYADYGHEIIQLQTSVSKRVAGYEMMTGQNPIYIVTLYRRNRSQENTVQEVFQ